VLDVIPAVLRGSRPKYVCRGCEGAVVQVKALPRLIDRYLELCGIHGGEPERGRSRHLNLLTRFESNGTLPCLPRRV
jgi:hypothetical protein